MCAKCPWLCSTCTVEGVRSMQPVLSEAAESQEAHILAGCAPVAAPRVCPHAVCAAEISSPACHISTQPTWLNLVAAWTNEITSTCRAPPLPMCPPAGGTGRLSVPALPQQRLRWPGCCLSSRQRLQTGRSGCCTSGGVHLDTHHSLRHPGPKDSHMHSHNRPFKQQLSLVSAHDTLAS
jgi:hypothetical protein